ncbi:hypothetical protein [Paractinoplanes hotanensis]|uniref:Uncharacterized protein n=1 Tax=Paractinoplanes hotanensis TaxID=2906497 RepID=A0ABT0XXV8_9ACTN|nr:hypothetical protein [Actinoplanes hotanensis]MCM4078624.1 hypothetical protein [Actinoplanes hotanensis]
MIRRILLLLAAVLAASLLTPSGAVAAPDDVVKVTVVRTPEQNGGRADSLGQIAQRTLGDSARAREILELNLGRPQSDGGSLAAAGQVRPGWILLVPGDATGPDVRLGRVGPDPGGADQPYFTWKLVLALVGAVVLALLTVLLFMRRRIVRWVRDRRRTRAENARLHREIKQRLRERAELVTEFAADQAGPRLAWQAAAGLAADSVEAYALRVGDREITAWVTSGHEPRPPWQAVSDGVWTRPSEAPHGQIPGGQLSPCLVRVGGGASGPLFVDLTWLDGVLAIGGSLGVAADVVRTLLTDLVRFRPDLPVLSVPGLGGEPVGVPSTATRLRSMADLRPSGAAAGTDDGMVRLASRRCALTAVIVLAEPPSAEEAEQLFAACGPGSGQVAVVLGDLPGAHWRWKAEVDGGVALPMIGVTVTAPAR